MLNKKTYSLFSSFTFQTSDAIAEEIDERGSRTLQVALGPAEPATPQQLHDRNADLATPNDAQLLGSEGLFTPQAYRYIAPSSSRTEVRSFYFRIIKRRK